MDESAAPAAARDAAIATLRAEHRSIADVMQLLQHLLAEIAAGHMDVDFRLLSSALHYMDDFACCCHHPKEDRHLFVAVRKHAPQLRTTVNGLQAEHQADDHYIRELHRLLVRFQAGAADALERLSSSLDVYAAILYGHMRKEEALLDAVADVLPDAEWRAIADGFAAEDDPLAGGSRKHEFAKLRERITLLLPRKMRSRSAESNT
jgi:hemerythrin-like domain-containing protein